MRQIEKNFEEYLRRSLNMKVEICERQEQEILSLKHLVKEHDELITKTKFGKGSMILDHNLIHQRSPHDKTGIGFDKSPNKSKKGQSPQPSQEKFEDKSRSHKVSREKYHDQQGSRRTQLTKTSMLKKGPFNSRHENNYNGFCYACSGFGHRDVDCTFHGRRSVGIQSNTIRC